MEAKQLNSDKLRGRRAPPAEEAQPKRGGSPRAIAHLVPKLTQTALGRRGLAEANLLANWPNIVGAERAAVCLPEKLAFPRGQRNDGTLHLRVGSAAALELQHDAPLLIERINGYFGYAAVARLRFLQAPLAGPKAKRVTTAKRRPDPSELATIRQRLQTIEDDEMRETLERLGLAILSESRESTKN